MSGSGSGDLRIRNMHHSAEELREARARLNTADWERVHELVDQVIERIGQSAYLERFGEQEHTASEWIGLFEQALAE